MTATKDAPAPQRRPAPAMDYRIRKFWRENQWYVIAIMGITGVGLGFWGFRQALSNEYSAFDCLFFTFQLLKLDMKVDVPYFPWQLQVARFLLPSITVYTVGIAFISLFKEQVEILRIRMLRGHLVVCGLGKKGMQLVKDLVDQGEKVVVIEMDPANGFIPTCNDLGVAVLAGDATNEAILKKANLPRAKSLVALCEEDSTNAEIALCAHGIFSAQGGPKTSDQKTYVHIHNKKFCDILEHNRKLTRTGVLAAFKFFNIDELSAKLMLNEYPPDRYANISPPDDEVCLWVVGFGDLGESVTVQAVKMAHYADGTRTRIVVVDEKAGAKRDIFLDRFPELSSITDVTVEFVDAQMDESGFLDTKKLWQRVKVPPDIVYMCLDEDSKNITAAYHLTRIPEVLDKPMVVNISKGEVFALTLQRGGEGLEGNVHMFPFIRVACTKELILQERLDSVAKAIHDSSYRERSERAQGYAKQMKALPKGSAGYAELRSKYEQMTKSESFKPWVMLDEAYKDSNRQQAEHIDIKLRAAGLRMVRQDQLASLGKGQTVVNRFEDRQDRLAKMEHNRWNAERFMSGWRYAKERTGSTSPYLVGWDQLTQEIRQYDRDAVDRIPKILASTTPKYVIVREKASLAG